MQLSMRQACLRAAQTVALLFGFMTANAALAATIHGTLNDASADPAVGVTVGFHAGASTSSGVSDSEGSYSVYVEPAASTGVIFLEAYDISGGAFPARMRLDLSTEMTVTSDTEIDLAVSASRVEVHVIDSDDEPVEGATVSAVHAYDPEENCGFVLGTDTACGWSDSTAVTDASGVAVMWLFDTNASGPDNRYDLHVVPPPESGLAPKVQDLAVDGTTEADVSLDDAVELSGTVTDALGDPAQGIDVVFTYDVWNPEVVSTTDVDGAYHLFVPAGAAGKLSMSAHSEEATGAFPLGYWYLETSDTLTIPVSTEIDLHIPASRLDVSVITAAEAPVIGASVTAMHAYVDAENCGLSFAGVAACGFSDSSGVSDGSGVATLWLFDTNTSGPNNRYDLTAVPAIGSNLGVGHGVSGVDGETDVNVSVPTGGHPASTALITPEAVSSGPHSGQYAGVAGFVLSASVDSGFGLEYIRYSIDSEPAVIYEGSPGVYGYGLHTLTYWATDSTGAVESSHTITFTNFEPGEDEVFIIHPDSIIPAVIGEEQEVSASAVGGIEPYFWSVSDGSLPPGMSLDAETGVISGTPTSTGEFHFQLTVEDDAEEMNVHTKDFTMVVVWPDVVFTAYDFPDGVVGESYAGSVHAEGGEAPLHWSIIGGDFPSGLSLNADTGAVSGMPTEAGEFTFTVRVEDSQTEPAFVEGEYGIVVEASDPVIVTPLPNARMGVAYSNDLDIDGGTEPYTWTIVVGALPPGMTLDASTGEISGISSIPGDFTFTVQVTDSSEEPMSVQMTYSLHVGGFMITTTLEAGTVGDAYSLTLGHMGGTSPFTWSIASGSLPTGMTIGSSTGVIGGTPTVAGTAHFIVKLQDGTGAASYASYVINVTE